MSEWNGSSNGFSADPKIIGAEIHHSMTVRDYLKVLFRHKNLILLTMLAVCLTTWMGLELKTPVYQAQVRMLVSAEKQIESPYYRDMALNNVNETTLTQTQSEIVKSKPVLERTVKALGLYRIPVDEEKFYAKPLKKWVIDWQMQQSHWERLTPRQQEIMRYRRAVENLKGRIKVEPVRDTHLFSIKVTDFNPVRAAVIANALSRSYIIFDLEQQYVDLQAKFTEKNPIVLQMKDNIDKIEKGLAGQTLPDMDAIGPASVKIIEQSTPPLEPLGLPRKLVLCMAFGMSLFLGVFLAFVFQFLDQTFHSKQDLEIFMGVPVIACINKKRGVAEPRLVQNTSDANRSPRATSYRILAQQILFIAKSRHLKTLLFASVNPRDDSEGVLANSAAFLSKRQGLRTLLIDANLRRPRLHKFFKTGLDRGLSEILEGMIRPEEAAHPIDENLTLIPAGRSFSDPAVLLNPQTLSNALSILRESCDLILINGADLRDFRDSALIAGATDGIFLIIGEGTVRRQVVHHSVQHLRDHHRLLSGIVMPNRRYLIPKFLYESL